MMNINRKPSNDYVMSISSVKNTIVWQFMAGGSLATVLKSVYKTKAMTLTLITWGCVVPGGSGDGTGFPANFGDWWRA